MAPSALTQRNAEDPDFWRSVCPELHIEASSSRAPVEIAGTDELVELLRVEGYVNVPDVLPSRDVELLRTCVERLHERRIPVVFAYVYDELWRAFQRVAPFLDAVLGAGHRALPAFWLWRVQPSESDQGWEPHRDRAETTVGRDNSPHTLTVWLALSEATPLNGCMYLLPAHLDERFRTREWDADEKLALDDLQNVRAQPATPGSMLAWNQGILHWGGRASPRAREPRVSAAFEFQRGDLPPFDEPLLDLAPVPPFRERLGLIGQQVLQYRHMYPLTAGVEKVALRLEQRFMPDGR